MKAYSAVVVTRSFEPNEGTVRIDFDEWPDDGEWLQDVSEDRPKIAGTVGQPVQVGGTGAFQETPANLVHLREIRLEDSRRGAGRAEIDDWEINSRVNRGRLEIHWTTPERRSKVEEIGFLVIGE